MRILFTGGGTAGHINPALAIAETVKKNDPGAAIAFVGVRAGKEVDLVPREGYPLYFVKAMGFQRPIASPVNIKAAWLALTEPYSKRTTRILDEFRPDMVIGTGGYACWPLMAAAARRGIPTALHESNALPGRAVGQLQERVDRVWINFESTADRLKVKGDRVLRVGNPLREGFGGISYEEARHRLGIPREELRILSFGGSLGAEELNRAVLEMMKTMGKSFPNVVHLHATGKRDHNKFMSLYEAAGLESCSGCIAKDYIYDMPLQMAATDLVIARAGAMTLSELALMQKACILIPSPNVTDNHQFVNAKTLADAGAAVLVEERELADGALTRAAEALIASADTRAAMAKKIRDFADPRANQLIWQDMQTLLKKQK